MGNAVQQNGANGQKGIDMANADVRIWLLDGASALRRRSGPEMTRRHAAPAHECMPETRGLAEAQFLGDAVDRHFAFAQQLLGPLKP